MPSLPVMERFFLTTEAGGRKKSESEQRTEISTTFLLLRDLLRLDLLFGRLGRSPLGPWWSAWQSILPRSSEESGAGGTLMITGSSLFTRSGK